MDGLTHIQRLTNVYNSTLVVTENCIAAVLLPDLHLNDGRSLMTFDKGC